MKGNLCFVGCFFLVLSGCFFVAGLWQLEMLWVQFQNRDWWMLEGFTMPFGYVVPWWLARDVYYLMLAVSFLLCFISCYLIGYEFTKWRN